MTTKFQATEVVQTIAQQVSFFKRRGQIKYKQLLQVDDNTLRVHHKTAAYIYNTNIEYDRARDTYIVTVFKIDVKMKDGRLSDTFGEVVKEATYTDVYVEDLPKVVGKA